MEAPATPSQPLAPPPPTVEPREPPTTAFYLPVAPLSQPPPASGPSLGTVFSPPEESLSVAPPPLSPAAAAARRETLEGLHRLLLSLQAADNAHWSSYRMLQRLLQRHTRVPPSIVQGAHPFVWDVLNGLVPQLEAAASIGAVPQEARRRLVECCLALTNDGLTPEQMAAEIPGQLARLQRLLEALSASTAAQIRALP